MEPIRSLYIVRHGETELNRRGIIQGRGIDPSINETGRSQAAAFFKLYKSEKFNHVLASSLRRTQETIASFSELGYKIDIHPELDEIGWGIHEGAEATPDMRQEYMHISEAWKRGELHHAVPEGESPLELKVRQDRFVHEILPSYSGKILICSHGRAMRALLCNLMGEPLSRMDEYPHKNTSLYLVEMFDDRNELRKFNDLSHLE